MAGWKNAVISLCVIAEALLRWAQGLRLSRLRKRAGTDGAGLLLEKLNPRARRAGTAEPDALRTGRRDRPVDE